ncbi:MAG: DUF2029 domain-containing protein [Clostridiales bacterium]|nr:DUF2029 domain-containing protein [Clostridiales bacterium]
MNTKKKIFFPIMTLGLIISIIMALATRGQILWEQIFQHDKTDVFMDFFHSVTDSVQKNPYSYGVLYPPITYLFYRFFAFFIPERHVIMGGYVLQHNCSAMMVYFFYSVIAVLGFGYIIRNFYKDKKTCSWLIVLLVLSGPALFLFERGNCVIVAFFFLGIYLLWKDSDSKVQRELALMALAISFCFKIYPALFGVMLIKEKRYKDAIRCIIYALLFFLVPFFAFGGIGAVGQWIGGVSHNMDKESGVNAGIGYKINFSSTYIALAAIFLRIKNNDAFMGLMGTFGTVTSIIAFAAGIFSKNKWKTIALFSCVMLGFPGFSYQYMMIFMAIPLCLFLEEDKKFDLWDLLYTILYIFQFILFTVNIITVAYLAGGVCLMRFLNFVECCGLLGMTWLLVIEVIYNVVKEQRSLKIAPKKPLKKALAKN